MIAPERALLTMKLIVTPPVKTLSIDDCRSGCAVRQIDSSDRFPKRPRANPADPGRSNNATTTVVVSPVIAADLYADLRICRHGRGRSFCLNRGHSNDAGPQD
jgi:hypothetical protein